MTKYEDCCNECGRKMYKIKKEFTLTSYFAVCKKCMTFKLIIPERDWRHMCE